MRFDEILYNDDLLDALEDMHFYECTPIQEQAIPAVESGSDVLALAQTGTGKTAAYLLPVIDIIADGGFPEDAINCVVMAPTRELALQIDQQMQGFAYFLPQISSAAIYGGTDGKTFDVQRKALEKGADVVIATPGRLIAHLQMGYLDLSKVSFFILDEADRMLDMGFIDDIKTILGYMPQPKQTLMFSATISHKIKKLADQLLIDPVEIKIALSKPPESIDQQAYIVKEAHKEKLLKHVLRSIPDELTIVFSSSKQNVKMLMRSMRSWHIAAAEMHSDLDQEQRERTLLDFRSGRVKVLVATDVVARGIDIDNITTIINYDVPRDAEDYVHRIGRTARASNTGRAITFIGEREREKFRRIEKLIEKTVPKMTLPEGLAPGEEVSDNRRGRRDKPRRSANQKRKPSRKAAKAKDNNKAQQPADSAPKAESGNSAKSKRKKHRRKPRPSVETGNQSTGNTAQIES